VDFELIGYNSRLDELQAAALRLFLPHVDEWNRERREAVARYAELGLGDVVELLEEDPGHVYHLFVVRAADRDRLASSLADASIGHAAYSTTPLHLQPAFRSLGYAEGSLPETERASRETLALPLWVGIDEEIQAQVVSTLRNSAKVEVA
jgi:dTDP-4-amino-4,6-dideoxygalactose transaminase